jgi:DUF2950 family protein
MHTMARLFVSALLCAVFGASLPMLAAAQPAPAPAQQALKAEELDQLVAPYPAEYGNSGVMTFLVNHAGAVFQKDLGPRTAKLAERITSFNPDQTWKKVDVTAP